MPTFKRGRATPDADAADVAELSAEEAEALAAAAEAEAAAARARANVLKVQQAKAEREAERETEVHDEVSGAEDEVAEKDTGDAGAAGDSAPLTPAAPRRRRLATVARYAAVCLAVIAIAALASTSAWIVVKHRQAEHQRDLAAQFSAAARQGVVSLMSLDFNRAKDDVQRIVDNSTGQFREDFQAQAEEFAKVAESSKVVTEANVTATAVQTMTEDTADVLVAAASTITNAQGAKDDPRSWRLIVSMARDGDQIKMAKVEFAP